MASSKETQLLLAILFVSAALRLGPFLVIQSVDPSRAVQSDSPSYDNSARALLRTGHFAVSPENPEMLQTDRTPGYPVFIAAVYLIFGESHFPVILIQILISIGTIMITYMIARTLWGSRSALISILLLTFDITSFYASQVLLTETLFTFFLVIAVAAGVHLALDTGKRAWVWSLFLGLAIASATMVRPISYYLIGPVLIGTLIFKKSAGWRWRQILLILFLTALPSITMVGGWQIRNYLATGSFELSAYVKSKFILEMGVYTVMQRDGIPFEEARRKVVESLPDPKDLSKAELYELHKQKGLSLIRQYPLLHAKGAIIRGLPRLILGPGVGGFVRYFGVRIENARIMGPSHKEYIKNWVLINPFQFIVFLLGLSYLLILYVGAAYSVRRIVSAEREALVAHMFVWGVILYFLIILAAPTVYSRFRIPIMPMLALYGGNGLNLLFQSNEK